MNQKRKAAANVFMEQQQLDEAPDAEQAPVSRAAPPLVGIPQQAPGGGMPPPVSRCTVPPPVGVRLAGADQSRWRRVTIPAGAADGGDNPLCPLPGPSWRISGSSATPSEA